MKEVELRDAVKRPLRGCMRILLFLSLYLLAGLANAVEFDEQLRSLPLGQHMDVFEDVRGDAGIDDITSPALDSSFRRNEKPVLNAGYSRSVFWLRVDLEYRPRELGGQQPWLLELAYPPLDHLDLYLPDGQGGFRLAQRTGDSLPFDSRQITHNMNRIWSAAQLDGSEDSVELRRARAMRPAVAAADHILDIHSTAQDVVPFWVYPAFERNAALANALPSADFGTQSVDDPSFATTMARRLSIVSARSHV